MYSEGLFEVVRALLHQRIDPKVTDQSLTAIVRTTRDKNVLIVTDACAPLAAVSGLIVKITAPRELPAAGVWASMCATFSDDGVDATIGVVVPPLVGGEWTDVALIDFFGTEPLIDGSGWSIELSLTHAVFVANLANAVVARFEGQAGKKKPNTSLLAPIHTHFGAHVSVLTKGGYYCSQPETGVRPRRAVGFGAAAVASFPAPDQLQRFRLGDNTVTVFQQKADPL